MEEEVANTSAINNDAEVTTNEKMPSDVEHNNEEEISEENRRATRSSVRGGGAYVVTMHMRILS